MHRIATLFRFGGIAIVATLALAGAGCGGDECEKIYEKLKECGEGEAPPKSQFVAACKEAKNSDKEKAEVAAMAECAGKDSCEAFETCQKAARAARNVAEIEKAIAAGEWKNAFDDCTLSPDYYANEAYKAQCVKVFTDGIAKLVESGEVGDVVTRCEYSEDLKKAVPEFAAACGKAASGGLESAMAEVRKARDAGTRDFKKCLDLKDMAGQAGGDAVAKAEALCKEMDLAENAKKGMDEARANAKAGKSTFPYQCKSTVEELDALADSSEWAKQTRAELLKACYVELGTVVIAEESKKASKYTCPFRIDEVKEMAAKYDLAKDHPELATALGNLPKPCNK